jgi:hypothetical protein
VDEMVHSSNLAVISLSAVKVGQDSYMQEHERFPVGVFLSIVLMNIGHTGYSNGNVNAKKSGGRGC